MITKVLNKPSLGALRLSYRNCRYGISDNWAYLFQTEINQKSLHSTDQGLRPSNNITPPQDRIENLKDKFKPYTELIRQIISDFYDSCEPINVSTSEANDLKILFLVLAEEVLHDEELKEVLTPDERFSQGTELSKVLYLLSEHFYDIENGKYSH